MSDDAILVKRQESRVRRRLAREGYALRRRKGSYSILHARYNALMYHHQDMDLDEVEELLTEMA